MRPPHWGWIVFVGGVITGAILVDLSGYIQAAPYRADAKAWRRMYDSVRVTDGSGVLFDARGADVARDTTTAKPDTVRCPKTVISPRCDGIGHRRAR